MWCNRRNELSKIKLTSKQPWGAGTIGTSIWKGVLLKDILEKKDILAMIKNMSVFQVQTKVLMLLSH